MHEGNKLVATTGAGFVAPQTLAVPAIVQQAQKAKVETTTVWVAQGGWAMEVTVPKLSGEALKAQQREQHAAALRNADKLNQAAARRKLLAAKTFG